MSGRLRQSTGIVMVLLAAATLVACALGPRGKRLSDRKFRPLEAEATVDVYIGQVAVPHEEIAIIETDASPYVDDAVRQRQLDQLREKARRLGANAIQSVRILAKHVRGYTPDERVPFTAWEQGQYELYFMRAVAVHMAEIEPSTLAEVAPRTGWLVQGMTPPPRLESVINQIPGPGAGR